MPGIIPLTYLCERQDHRGVRCVKAMGHPGSHRFRPWQATVREGALLREILAQGTVDRIGVSDLSAQALADGGWIIREHIVGLRWRLRLTVSGEALARTLSDD